jgi:thiamine-phosphate pyrophosphorylase
MNRPAFFDLSLYLVTDPALAGDRALLDVVGDAVCGGVTLVQIRDKRAEARDLLDQTLALKRLLDPLGVPLLVNDRVDIAAAAGVGCHIGQTDLPPAAARAILGEDAIIGLSIDDPDQTPACDPLHLDYVAHGPFAVTGSKADAGLPVGAPGIARVREKTALPMVAIGGIDAGNAAEAIRAGADGIAVISAILGASDPKAAAGLLRGAVDRAKGMRKEAAA